MLCSHVSFYLTCLVYIFVNDRNYAIANRMEWEETGSAIVDEMLETAIGKLNNEKKHGSVDPETVEQKKVTAINQA